MSYTACLYIYIGQSLSCIIIQQKIRSPDYEWLQSVSNHELTQKSSRPSITNEAQILRIDQGTKVHNFGALQSGENFWFLKEWFPISLVHRVADVMRFVAGKSGSLEIIASCSNKKDVEMVTSLLYSLLTCY